MNNNKEMLDRIKELLKENSESEIVFFVNNEELSDVGTYSIQEIKSVVFDYTHTTKKKGSDLLFIGKDDIFDDIAENVFDEELSKVNGNYEDVIADDLLDAKAEEIFKKYEKEGIITKQIVVTLGG